MAQNKKGDGGEKGFGGMDPEKQKDLASKGGESSQGGRSSEERSQAARKAAKTRKEEGNRGGGNR